MDKSEVVERNGFLRLANGAVSKQKKAIIDVGKFVKPTAAELLENIT